MPGISRNDPCPCGSGKKYKKCCLRKDAELEREDRLRGQAAGIALDWLDSHFESEMDELVRKDFLGVFDDESLAEMPEGMVELAIINAREYSLCEGRIQQDGALVSTLDLVLGLGGPLMEAGQRQYLQSLQEAPLSLYEVLAVEPGHGFTLRDLLDESIEPRQVTDRQASEVFEVGECLGARLVPGRPWDLSGAIYEFHEEVAPEVVEAVKQELAEAPPGFDRRFLQGRTLVDCWLSFLVWAGPRVVTSYGDPVLLITDYYRVKDRDGLTAALDAEQDVELNQHEDGTQSWARLEDPDEDFPRPILAINPGKDHDHIEVFARTQNMADDGKDWFQGVAGETVEFMRREIVDPLSPKAMEGRGGQAEPFDISQLPEGFLQDYMEKKIYASWADDPIPALGGKTPREAIASEEGKRRVIELLESYSRDQVHQAQELGSQAVDFGFLWKELGLEAPKDGQ